MKWYRRSGVIYGFSAGVLGGVLVALTWLLIHFGVARFEVLPPDAPVARQQEVQQRPITRDSFTAVPPAVSKPESSTDPGKISTKKHPHHPKPVAPVTPGTGGGTGTTTKPSTPAKPAPPAAPPAAPVETPKPVRTRDPITVTIPLPLLPVVKVTIPPLLRVSTGSGSEGTPTVQK